MLKRYTSDEKGRRRVSATIYTQQEHNIPKELLDSDAVKIIQRLDRSGYEAFIVGGAVRDLLFGRKPKDFDLVTSAEPNQIRKIFRNSRIIGKRFRLVHVYFPDDKIIELSTFRSLQAGTYNNEYGTIEEDAQRRDFSINGLYFDPIKSQLVDFVDGYPDIKARKLRSIIPHNIIFKEDPVRMVRAIKYAVIGNCKINLFLKNRIKKDAHLLSEVSSSRMGEELFKLLKTGFSSELVKTFQSYKLFLHFLPNMRAEFQKADFFDQFVKDLSVLDIALNNGIEVKKGVQLAHLLGRYLITKFFKGSKRPNFIEVYTGAKEILKPLTPPNIDVEDSIAYAFKIAPQFQKTGQFPTVLKLQTHHKPERSEFEKDIAQIHEKRFKRRRRPKSPPII